MNLFVGNLSPQVTKEDLHSLFSEHGEVTDIKIIVSEPSGEPRGFGFVRFANQEDAQNAIAALNDAPFQGQNLKVNNARTGRERRAADRRKEKPEKWKGKDHRKGSRRDKNRRKTSFSIGRTRDEVDKFKH